MINKAKEIIESKEVKTVIGVASAVAELAGKGLVSFCKLVANTVKKLKED